MRHLSMVNSISYRYLLIASWKEDSDLGLPRNFGAIIELEMGLDELMEGNRYSLQVERDFEIFGEGVNVQLGKFW